MKIIVIKNGDDFAFTLLLVGVVLIWIASSVFFNKNNYNPERQEWLDSQPRELSTGVDY